MDKYVKDNIAVINANTSGYLSARNRKLEKKKLQNLYNEFEELKNRVKALEEKHNK